MTNGIIRKQRLDRSIKVRTEGFYALSGLREMLYLAGPRLFLILGLLAAPFFVPSMYWQRVICLVCIYGLLAIGFDFLANFVGLVSLGGALFVGIGGYITGGLNSCYGLPPALTIPIATIGGALICTVILLPTLPLRGVYFAVVSIVYPLLMARVVVATAILGGTEGLTGLATSPNIWVDLYLTIGVTLIAVFGLRRLVNADIGLVFRAIKDNDQAVKASAISTTFYKAEALFISSAIGCFAGAYLSYLYGWAGITFFALDFSILPISAAVLGGMGTLVGPLLGAVILVPLSEILRALGTLRIVFYALILILFIGFRPEGLMNYFQRKYHQFERWKEV